MKVCYSSDKEANINGCVATVGFFDGVHAGHRFLIDELKTQAKLRGKKSVVFTFAVHPRKVLQSDFQPLLLTTLDEKLAQLETTGVDACVILNFTPQMSQLSAYNFLKEVLFEQYDVRTLLVGHDHRFGYNRADGFDDYVRYGKEIGIEVIRAERYSFDEHNRISSSEVRWALQQGDITMANALLAYSYSFIGVVVKGFELGSKIGFPTANLKPKDHDKLIPALGVYAVRVKWNDKTYNGMMNIGIRPTLTHSGHVSLEVNIFDFDEDIYHQDLEIKFIRKIRDEEQFKGVEQLIEQLKIDKQNVLKLFEKIN